MQEDSADALAGYPGSHLDSVAEFLVGQYQKDAVGPMQQQQQQTRRPVAACWTW